MSNYIDIFVPKGEIANPESLYERIHKRAVIGFNQRAVEDIPKVAELPDLRNMLCFCLSDKDDTLVSEYLMYPADMSPDNWGKLPYKLMDRIALIVRQIQIIFEEASVPVIHAWLSEVDQLEDARTVFLSSLHEELLHDFAHHGVPCRLYKISKG